LDRSKIKIDRWVEFKENMAFKEKKEVISKEWVTSTEWDGLKEKYGKNYTFKRTEWFEFMRGVDVQYRLGRIRLKEMARLDLLKRFRKID